MSDLTHKQRAGLDHLRARILACAASKGIAVEESVKWGQPSFKAPHGSPLRIGCPKQGSFALYAHCATSLIADYAALHPGRFEGNCAVLFDTVAEAEAQPLEALIMAALTYHRT
ncbi:uncharacterized protein DUF1801 [Litoreibacter ponti]|uniref:Uncharacterized protein DUF1801 n=1 Tax=Litoreibacter ponti TaxID=1510457 RepID=A0A2T6BMS5_9RHOB|nr:DUF1801 domain-containing protein [Litoreibacter ponti]PTX57334.1 uncharacterized protein DUF1801 [Litoreibacter ponti]